MDISALLGGLISDKTVNEVSRKSGASKKDVSSVLTTALPLLLASGSNTTAAQVSEESGVSQNTTSNVLSAAAPLLLGSLGGGPKIYSAQHALAFCRFSAPTLKVLSKLFWPLSKLLIRSKVITKRFANHEEEMLTVDDLEKAMELTDKKDIAEEAGMLKGIIRFGGEMAKEIMTSRVDIVDLDIKDSFKDVLACIVANNYSRIPVYQGRVC